MKRFLLCTDLDRTLIPNGNQPESPAAKGRFKKLVDREEIKLTYVSGRHRALVEQAIADFDLPQPDFVIADLGTTLYRINASGWQQVSEWDNKIASDWQNFSHQDMYRLLSVFPALRLQEKEKQNTYKLSFYVSPQDDKQKLMHEVALQLTHSGIRANLIWSRDEMAGIELLDVLPATANKLHAIHFLMRQENFSQHNTVFAGDSGNDMDVLLSDIPSVLVANASDEIKKLVASTNKRKLYIASGGYLGMNGNYAAGILEGMAHFLPEAEAWMKKPESC